MRQKSEHSTTGADAGRRDETGITLPVRKERIDSDTAGQRIDNYLSRMLPGVPRGRIYRLLRRGEVRVNGGRIRAEYKLAAGDEVRIPPVRQRPQGAAPELARSRRRCSTRSSTRTSACS